MISSSGTSISTTASTGTLANSGWQFEGDWGGFLGTAISSNFFITAKHVGGAVGDTFSLNGASYLALVRTGDGRLAPPGSATAPQ